MLSQSENIRHISLPANMITELKDKLCIMKNLYTLCVDDDNSIIPKKVLQEILKNLGKLRVIYLPWYVDDLPDCIGNLKHLRYLNIGGSLPVKKLPGSICKLYHLQTLVLPSCESVPKNFCELISLRRFSTDRETISHISDVGRLTSLQSISQFVVKKEPGHELHQLENLIQLRGKMCITGLENVANIEDAVKANMQIKKHLEGLELEWKSDERATEAYRVLDALQPHPNISSLKITSYGGNKFPGWLVGQNSLRHLKSLELVGCSKVEEIPSIEESLPSCKFLTLGVLNNLKELPTLPLDLKSLTVNWIPQVSYFSENDLLMKEKRKQSLLEVLKQIAECPLLDLVPLSEEIKPTVRKVLQLVKESLNTAPKICITSSLCGDIFSKIERINPWSNDYSMEQLLDALVMCMQYHLETMLSKNEESRLVLPSSLTFLWIASCSITSDALSSCIQSLVFLSELKLSEIQTITSLPPKEVLCALKNLCSLTIDRCLLLCSLGGIGALTSLTELQLNGCLNLNASNEPLPSSLEKLEFWGCVNADIILAKSNLPVLDVLVVDYCGQLSKEQERVLHVSHLSSIKELHIMNWKGHLEVLNSLTSLYQLSLVNCPEINRSSPVEKYSSRLEIVLVDNPLLLKLMLSDETLSSIEMLSIFMNRGNYLDDDVFPYLTSLTYLLFYECNITHLLKNLKNLSSLFHLELQHCPNLCELEDLPQNLCELKIKDCPTLTDRFKKGGPYRVRIEEGSTMFEFRSSFHDISN